ncbi:MAG: integrin alpha, partial [Myxococcota bacterium]
GTALAAGDPDGDGDADLVVGAPYDPAAGTSAGVIRVYEDALLGGGSAPDATLTGTDANDMAGIALAFLTDGDGDDTPELVVGAYRESTLSGGAGAVYVLDALPRDDAPLQERAVAIVLGESSGDFFGRSVADGGDIDGDGLGDLLVGAYAADTGGANTGAAYVFFGPVLDTLLASEADAVRHGTGRSDGAGFGLAGGGDVDGDGYADFVVGAFNNDDGGYTRGAAYVVRGPVSGTGALGEDATLHGEADNDSAGRVVALGDLDADGFSDVAVSADANAWGGGGGVWVAYGPLAGVTSLADVEARVLGEDRDDAVGEAFVIGGDHDGDGFPELFVGAPDEDTVGR